MELLPNETLHEVNEHIRLIQRAEGLTFGTDAYLLAAYVRPRRGTVAVDLGSGTGIIPLLCLKREKASRFTAVELQPVFCDLITRNAELNGLSPRLTALPADVRELTAAAVGGEVELVTANPPYMAPDSGYPNTAEEKYLARHEVAGGISDFCAAAGRVLKHGGRFVCVFRPERLADLFAALRAAHLEPKRMTTVQATAASVPSMVLVEAVKYAAPSLYVTPALILTHDGRDSEDKAYIYDRCLFPEKYFRKYHPITKELQDERYSPRKSLR